jgi:hypothetical protein
MKVSVRMGRLLKAENKNNVLLGAPSIQSVDDLELFGGERRETDNNPGARLIQTPSTQLCGNGGTGARAPIR